MFRPIWLTKAYQASVPVLWDKSKGTIVSNESSDILRMFNSEFDALGALPAIIILRPCDRKTIASMIVSTKRLTGLKLDWPTNGSSSEVRLRRWTGDYFQRWCVLMRSVTGTSSATGSDC